MLEQVASTYAETILAAIQQEYPNQMQHTMTGPEDRPRPREAHPAFYGCFDWHSSVHMHWSLIRLLRLAPDAFDHTKAITVLEAHLTRQALAQEAGYLRAWPRFERPYGWGWALTLAHELTLWEAEVAASWLEALRPQPAGDRQAVQPRHRHVEHDRVRHRALDRRQRGTAVRRRLDVVALGGQRSRQHPPDRRVVVHEEQLRHRKSRMTRCDTFFGLQRSLKDGA